MNLKPNTSSINQVALRKKYVDEDTCGTIDDVENEFLNPAKGDDLKPIKNIFDIYTEYSNSWLGGAENFNDDDHEEDTPDETPWIRTEPKTGRNEPCPFVVEKNIKSVA